MDRYDYADHLDDMITTAMVAIEHDFTEIPLQFNENIQQIIFVASGASDCEWLDSSEKIKQVVTGKYGLTYSECTKSIYHELPFGKPTAKLLSRLIAELKIKVQNTFVFERSNNFYSVYHRADETWYKQLPYNLNFPNNSYLYTTEKHSMLIGLLAQCKSFAYWGLKKDRVTIMVGDEQRKEVFNLVADADTNLLEVF